MPYLGIQNHIFTMFGVTIPAIAMRKTGNETPNFLRPSILPFRRQMRQR